MENQSRIEQLLAESLKKFDRLSDQMEVLTTHVDYLGDKINGVKEEVKAVQGRMVEFNDEIRKLTIISGEQASGFTKLADNHDRINRLEREVFK